MIKLHTGMFASYSEMDCHFREFTEGHYPLYAIAISEKTWYGKLWLWILKRRPKILSVNVDHVLYPKGEEAFLLTIIYK